MTDPEKQVAFWQTGTGPPVVALGGVHCDHSYLRVGLEGLTDQATVTYVDHRGTGASPPVSDPETLTHATWISDVASLLDSLEYDRVVLLGHSYGGFLAQEFALRYPERLSGLILCSTAPAFDYGDVVMGNAAQRGTPEQVKLLNEAFGSPVASDERLADIFRGVLSLYFHELRDEYLAVFDEGTTYSATAFNRAYFECLPHFDVVDRLPEIDVPSLVICGREDWICPPTEGAERLHAGLPDARLMIFEKSGHYPCIEETDSFVRAVSGWLRDVNSDHIPS